MEGDDEFSQGFIVISGRVALLKSSISGKELIVHLLDPGDVLSLVLMLPLDEQQSQLSARTLSSTKVLWVPVAQFRSLLNKHPDLYRELFANVISMLQLSFRLSLSLAHDHVDVRIAATLAALAQRTGTPNDTGHDYSVHLTRQQLADLTGTTSETAIRITRAMQKQGLLDIGSRGVIRIPRLDQLEEVAQRWA
jgi:CRP/FNR family transcriptional regulator